MRKLLLGAAAALAAFSVPAGPADGQMRASAVTVHVAADRGEWRGDRMRWQGDRGWQNQRRWQGERSWRRGDDWAWRGDRRWRDRDDWAWRDDRRWRGRNHWRWRSDPWLGWGVARRNPCRGYWWDGWAWRCRW